MLDRFFNPYHTIHKWDRSSLGFTFGIIAPPIFIVLFVLLKQDELPSDYLNIALHSKSILSPLLSLGLIANLFVFFIFVQKNYMNASRGVILSTFIWAIPIIYTKFF